MALSGNLKLWRQSGPLLPAKNASAGERVQCETTGQLCVSGERASRTQEALLRVSEKNALGEEIEKENPPVTVQGLGC